MAAKKGYTALKKGMLEQDLEDVDLKGYPVKGAKFNKPWVPLTTLTVNLIEIPNYRATIILHTRKDLTTRVLGAADGLSPLSANLGALLTAAAAHGEQDLLGLARHVAPKRVNRIETNVSKEDLVKLVDSPIDDLKIIARELLKEAPS